MRFLLFFFFAISSFAEAPLHAILLAGGGGTRLWPSSTDEFPKQFIDFGTGESLLQQTVRRLLELENLSDIVIATSCRYEPLVRAQMTPFEGRTSISILIEPMRRNTAPAIAYAVKFLSEVKGIAPQDPILVVPADHLIDPVSEWTHATESALPAVQEGKIVLFGIEPTQPETGFGYLEIGNPLDSSTYQVNRFIEKPNRQKAEELLQSKNVFWNAGIFAFAAKTFWSELQRYSPEIYRLSSSFDEMSRRFSEMPDLSIDYAVMEKSSHVAACPLSLNWSDIGSWDGLYEVLEKNSEGNTVRGDICEIDTKNSLLFSQNRPIIAIGLEDLIVVETKDALLICKRGESQKIKTALKKLQEK